MRQFLRIGFRLERWYQHPDIDWLQPGELQADALMDFRIKGNGLSVYEVPDPRDEAFVHRIAVAVAAGQQDPGTVGYAIFDGEVVSGFGVRIERVVGETGDEQVNQLHCNLAEITAEKLLKLAGVVAAGTMKEILSKRVRQLIEDGVRSEYLKRERVNSKLLAQLNL